MDVHFLFRSLVGRSAHQTKWTGCTRLSGGLRVAAFLILAAIAAALPAVQAGKAQATRTGKTSSIVSSGNPQKGKIVFRAQGCSNCHGSDGEGVSAPSPDGGLPRIASTTLALPIFIELVRKPKGQMPPFGRQQVSDRELADVYAFLRSSTPAVGHEVSSAVNIGKGRRLFTMDGCYECHLTQGQGARQTGGSRIGPPPIPLSAFISYVRQPTGQMPPYTQKTVSNEDLKDMYVFLQSVPQSPSWKNIPLLNP
ncbi:MAG: c-type cytochrome [Acidobacteriaceae bacterium]